jgi:hypothetical protein
MSFLGNIAAAQQAKAIGKYNNDLYQQQADYAKAKAEQNAAIFDNVTKPRLVEQQTIQHSNLLVKILNSGADFRSGETGYLVNLKDLNNQAFDLAMATYNKTMDYQDQINNSLLLRSKGEGELYKGNLTARTQYISAVGSLLGDASTGYDLYSKYGK